MPNLAQSPRARAVALSAAVFLAALLAGCGPAAGGPTASPSPSLDAMFDSDEKAFEAAIATYERYLEISAAINTEGGAAPDRVLEVTNADYGNQLMREFRRMEELGIRSTGREVVRNARLGEIDALRERLELLACVNVADTRIIDANGVDITPARDEEAALAVSLVAPSPGKVLISGSELWPGADLC